MKKITIITASVFAIFVLIVSSCASRRQTVEVESAESRSARTQRVINYTDTTLLLQQIADYTAAGFPLQEIRGYTDSMLVAKYLNVDLESFRRLRRERLILNMPIIRWLEHPLERIAQKERQLMIARERHNYPDTQIRDIAQALRWLLAVYQNNEASRADLPLPEHRSGWGLKSTPYFLISYYKQVGDGFLVKGWRGSFTDIVLPYCDRSRDYGIFLVGYDHNIVEIKRWRVRNYCPVIESYAEINIKIRYPEFEGADVRLPERVRYRLDSRLAAHIGYPVLALEMNIHGTVVASFIVDADGVGSDVEIVRSGGDPLLDREVLRTVRAFILGSQWIPGTKNGEKIPMEIQVEVEFGAIQWVYDARRRYVPPPSRENIRVNIVGNRNNCDCVSAFD